MDESIFVNSGDTKNSEIRTARRFPSDERLHVYLKTCRQHRGDAIHLYGWNTAISAAFYPPLQILEVALRESIIMSLENEFGEEWYHGIADVLDSWTVSKIEEGKNRILKQASSTSFSSVANKLNFGFWVSMIAPTRKQNYTDNISHFELYLWRPALRATFPFTADLELKQARLILIRLKRLRNLIAHHEPIYLRELEKEYQIILDVLGWMSPRARNWVESRSRVEEVLKNRRSLNFVRF